MKRYQHVVPGLVAAAKRMDRVNGALSREPYSGGQKGEAMREPPMGDSLYHVRHALYELRHEHGKTGGATQIDVLNHLQVRKRPVPSSNIDRVLDRLVELKRAELVQKTDSVTTTRYALTTDGELEDEYMHRRWVLRVFDEIRQPPTAAKIIIATVGVLVGAIVQRGLALLH